MLKVQPSTLRTPSCPRSPEWLCHLTRRVDSLKTGLTSSLPGLPHLAHGVRPSRIPNRKTQVAEPEILMTTASSSSWLTPYSGAATFTVDLGGACFDSSEGS